MRVRVSVTRAPGPELRGTTRRALHVRVPGWAAGAPSATVNAKRLGPPPVAGSFLEARRSWQGGDVLELALPVAVRAEPLRHDGEPETLHALTYGPHVLAGLADPGERALGHVAQEVRRWAVPVPAETNSALVSLGLDGVVVRRGTGVELVDVEPRVGSDAAAAGTWRLVGRGPRVSVESFDRPGLFLGVDDGRRLGLTSSGEAGAGTFEVAVLADGTRVLKSGPHELEVRERYASYPWGAHWTLAGGSRSFLLLPLSTLVDEHYTVYFELTRAQRT